MIKYVKFVESFKGESEIAVDIVTNMIKKKDYFSIMEKQYQFNKRFFGME